MTLTLVVRVLGEEVLWLFLLSLLLLVVNTHHVIHVVQAETTAISVGHDRLLATSQQG